MLFTAEVEVEVVEPMGSDMLVWCKLGPDNLTLRASAESGVKVGDR